jgi:hypothetical protein
LGNVKLNSEQEALIAETRKADDRWRLAKRTAEEEVRREVEKKIQDAASRRLFMVQECLNAGISYSKIGKEGLGSKHPRIVQELIEVAPHIAPEVKIERPAFMWADKENGILAVNYSNFPTSYTGDGYPEILSGIVQLDDTERVGMRVLADASDIEKNGIVQPGFLHYEIGKSRGVPDELRGLILAWAEANA